VLVRQKLRAQLLHAAMQEGGLHTCEHNTRRRNLSLSLSFSFFLSFLSLLQHMCMRCVCVCVCVCVCARYKYISIILYMSKSNHHTYKCLNQYYSSYYMYLNMHVWRSISVHMYIIIYIDKYIHIHICIRDIYHVQCMHIGSRT
jgi:hypothetical protein